MQTIEKITNTLDFARELAFGMELNPTLPNEVEILGVLQVMNAQLRGCGDDIRALFWVDTAFLVPDYPLQVEQMTDAEFAASAIAESVVKARLDHFEWTGNLIDSGFGLRLYGLDIIEPERRQEPTAFVPLHAVNLRLAA